MISPRSHNVTCYWLINPHSWGPISGGGRHICTWAAPDSTSLCSVVVYRVRGPSTHAYNRRSINCTVHKKGLPTSRVLCFVGVIRPPSPPRTATNNPHSIMTKQRLNYIFISCFRKHHRNHNNAASFRIGSRLLGHGKDILRFFLFSSGREHAPERDNCRNGTERLYV